MRRILVTGANGCIGARLCRCLLADSRARLLAQVRSAQRLSPDLLRSDAVQPVIGDLAGDRRWIEAIGAVEQAVLTATTWSGPDCTEANVTGTLALMKRLAETGCRRIYYLSSASLLDPHRELRPAELFATHDYLRTKRQLLVSLAEQTWRERIQVIYPTLVISDRAESPLSGAVQAIDWLVPRLRWICRLRGEACFHYVHADDLAALLRDWLIDGIADGIPEPLVIGSPPQSLADLVRGCQRMLGQDPRWHLRVSPRLVFFLAKLFRVELSPWDRHCLQHSDLCYDRVLTPSNHGIETRAPSLVSYLAQWIAAAQTAPDPGSRRSPRYGSDRRD